MTVYPVFARDLCSQRYLRQLCKERLSAGAVAGVIFIGLAWVDWWAGTATLTRWMRMIPIAGLAPWLLLLIGLTLGAKLLSAERREGTLPLLLLTPLTGADILLGKLLMALTMQFDAFLAAVPALVLPMVMVGFGWDELGLMVLAGANVLFSGLALGLFLAIFLDENKVAGYSVLLTVPLLASSTPLAMFLPTGPFREWLAAVRWFNPAEAMAHVPAVTGGFRPSAFWCPLLGSHLLAWCLLGLGGLLLPRASRWQAGVDLGSRRRKRWAFPNRRIGSRISGRDLLTSNAFFWLASRHAWPTVQIWLYLLLPPLGWAGLAWVAWAKGGTNITIVFVIAMAVSWAVAFLITVPAEASRRLLDDRESGALEMLLCTPLTVREIVRGQWLALRHRYLAPLMMVLFLSAVLMVSGCMTSGFGGMLDQEDRACWLFTWLAGLVLLPLSLTALSWVAMRRTLFARNAGEASGIAFVHVIGFPWFALGGASMLLHSLCRWNPDWWQQAWLLVSAFGAIQAGFAWRARTILLRDLRHAAASRYAHPSL